jgi:hypothetical protein
MLEEATEAQPATNGLTAAPPGLVVSLAAQRRRELQVKFAALVAAQTWLLQVVA